jgi:hypothetical protein
MKDDFGLPRVAYSKIVAPSHRSWRDSQSRFGPAFALNAAMTAEAWVRLIEEMIDLKLARFAETNMKLSPDLTRLLQDKRDTDRQRLHQIRTELARAVQGV